VYLSIAEGWKALAADLARREDPRPPEPRSFRADED
jgi:hypothetical protein